MARSALIEKLAAQEKARDPLSEESKRGARRKRPTWRTKRAEAKKKPATHRRAGRSRL